jgi:hypothetical protein
VGMVKVKKGVVFKAFRFEMIELIDFLRRLSIEIGKDLWITSANDSKHRKNSYHYEDLALDIRTRNLTKEETETVVRALKYSLGMIYYDTVLEKDHIHIEFDQRRFEEGGK